MSIKSIMFAAALALASFTTAANATSTGFNGIYDYATWASYNSNGLYEHITNIDAAQQTLTLAEPDNCDGEKTTCTLGAVATSNMFSHAIASDGLLSFNWNFNWDIDACCSGLNLYVNSTMYSLRGGNATDPYAPSSSGSGTFSMAVSAGDIIAFDAYSADSCCRASTSTITDFSAPSDVPEPASIALVALGLVGIGFGKSRKV